MNALQQARQLDVRGKTITTFIAHEIHDAFADMSPGDRVVVVTDAYPAIETDLRSWCRATGNRLVDIHTGGLTWRFTIEKGHSHPAGHKLAVVISDDGLLELLSPLGFAVAGALEGHEVALYVQGPAVRVLARGYRASLHGAARPFSRFPRNGLATAGHISPQEKIIQLEEFGARIFVCGPSMEHYKVEHSDLVIDSATICEYLTFVEEMNTASMHIFA